MMLFSWFSHNDIEPETALRLSDRKNKNRLNLKAKNMWPVAKVRQMPESLINSNKRRTNSIHQKTIEKKRHQPDTSSTNYLVLRSTVSTTPSIPNNHYRLPPTQEL